MRRLRIGALVVIAACLLIARMTLLPTGTVATTPRWCLVCGEHGLQDVVLNVALFLPLGAGLGLLGLRTRQTFGIALALSLAIELLQVRLVTGRDASLSDLLTNTAGATVATALVWSWRAWLVPPPRIARVLLVCATVSWLALLSFTGWALTPSVPPASAYYGQWQRSFRRYTGFPGHVRGVWLGRIPVPDHRVPELGAVRRALLDGPAEFVAIVTDGGPLAPRRVAPIASIVHPGRLLLITLEQEERDVLFRVRTKAAVVRLRSPAARLSRVFSPSAQGPQRGNTLRLTGVATRGRLRVASVALHPAGQVALGTELPLGPGFGWSFLWPFRVPTGYQSLGLSALWLAALAAPAGYWASWAVVPATRARNRLALLAAGCLLGGLLLLPAVWRIAPAQAIEWTGCVAGLAAGYTLARRIATLPR